MADKKISALTAVSSLNATDVFPVVQSAATKKADLNDVLNLVPTFIAIACGDETTVLTAATDVATFRMPYAMTVTEVRASLTTAGTGAALVTVDIHESGTTILSTKITLDASEKTSTTAATAPVISDSALADDAEITIDVDQIDTDNVAAGLKVYLIGTRAAV
jgi:hypothetical protein